MLLRFLYISVYYWFAQPDDTVTLMRTDTNSVTCTFSNQAAFLVSVGEAGGVVTMTVSPRCEYASNGTVAIISYRLVLLVVVVLQLLLLLLLQKNKQQLLLSLLLRRLLLLVVVLLKLNKYLFLLLSFNYSLQYRRNSRERLQD